MTEQDIAEQAYNNGYNQAIKDTAYKIECLQEENKILKSPKYGRWKVKFFNAQDKNAELQKQVDELKSAYNDLLETCRACNTTQAVKDTAKEIFEKIFELLCCFTTQGKSEDYNEGYTDCLAEVDKRLQNLAKEHGVEVE